MPQEPIEDIRTEEELQEEAIRSENDAEEILVRDVNDRYQNYKEVVLRSKKLNSQVRTVHKYNELKRDGKLVGRRLKGNTKTIEDFGTQKDTTLQIIGVDEE